MSSMVQTLPSPLPGTESWLCSPILPDCNSNNLQESLWREGVTELRVNCYSVADTDKSFQPHHTWLNYVGRHVSQFNHVLENNQLKKKREKKTQILLLRKLHLHIISVELLWWHLQRTPVGQKEINLLLQRRSLLMPEGKLVQMYSKSITKQVIVKLSD